MEFDRAYNLAVAIDRRRAHTVILRRFARLQKSKSWSGYVRLCDENGKKLPDGFMWMRRLEELAGFAKQTVSTAQQVDGILES